MNVKGILTPRALVAALFLLMLALPTAVIASPPAQGPVYATPGPGGSFTYVVQPGDDLFRLALRFNTTIAAIQAANNIVNPNLIFVGQQLTIPSISPAPPPEGSTVYIVQPGDNLFRLALRFNTTIYAIQIANGIPNANLIFVGQRLIIPTGTGGYAVPAAPYPNATPAQAPTITPTESATSAAAPTLESTPSTTTGSAVSIVNTSFEPNAITVHVGTVVTWTNNDSIQHTVTSGIPNSPSGLFDSGTLNPGQGFSFTFTSVGTFPYYCRIHGAAMTGTVTVTP